jgi:hypothetical protein
VVEIGGDLPGLVDLIAELGRLAKQQREAERLAVVGRRTDVADRLG